MSAETTTAPPQPLTTPDTDPGAVDRAFLMQMLVHVPLIAVAFAAAAWVSHQINAYIPVGLLCLGMIACAVVDGWKFKVPNVLTLPMVLSGWMIGGLHDFRIAIGPGPVGAAFQEATPLGGSFGAAFVCTLIGFLMLFPALFMGGMGQGDVKMQMGFGSWVGALYGFDEGWRTTIAAVCLGMLAGGVIALGMMVLRGELHKNLQNFQEILKDFKVLALAGPKHAAARAKARRPYWHRLPYGIPLCIGFLGYLAMLHFSA